MYKNIKIKLNLIKTLATIKEKKIVVKLLKDTMKTHTFKSLFKKSELFLIKNVLNQKPNTESIKWICNVSLNKIPKKPKSKLRKLYDKYFNKLN